MNFPKKCFHEVVLLFQKLHSREAFSDEDKRKLQQDMDGLEKDWNSLEELLNKTLARYAIFCTQRDSLLKSSTVLRMMSC